MRFSDRVGITTPDTMVYTDSIPDSLRNSLWNFLLKNLFAGKSAEYSGAIAYIAEHFFRLSVDELPYHGFEKRYWLRKIFFDETVAWYQTYNLLEFIIQHGPEMRYFLKPEKTIPMVNTVLTEERAGYRFVGQTLAPISSEAEVQALSDAIETMRRRGFVGAQMHLESAIRLLSQKPTPDYRNSIKESISAIESAVKQITGDESGGLDKALAVLDRKAHFHGAFKAGLLALYGYTSDEDGIRHAILEEPRVGFDEAKFMLVGCSAFVSFIVAKAAGFTESGNTE